MKLTLPSNKEVWVELDPTLVTIGDAGSMLEVVTKAITAWNLQDDTGKDLKVTVKNVGKLPFNDVRFLRSKLDFQPTTEMMGDLMVALANTEPDNRLPVPIEFTYFQYRREMGITYQQLMETPIYIFKQDLQFINLEAEARRKNAEVK